MFFLPFDSCLCPFYAYFSNSLGIVRVIVGGFGFFYQQARNWMTVMFI
jgi:hypothetical protein